MQGVFEVKRLIWLIYLLACVAVADTTTILQTTIDQTLTRTSCSNPNLIQTLINIGTGGKVSAMLAQGTSTAACPATIQPGQMPTELPGCSIDTSVPSVSCLTYRLLMPKTACSSENGEATPQNNYSYACLYVNGTTLIGLVRYKYDTTPNNISISSFSAGNGRITIHINDLKSGKNDYKPNYLVCYGTDKAAIQKIKDDQAGDCRDQQTKESTSSPILITGLENDTTYYFTAKVPGSQWDTVNSATPELSYGFGTAYNGAASPLSCTQTSATPASWILFLLLAIFLRRKTSPLAPFIFLLATPLFADLGQLNVGITGTPYRPALDSSTKSDGATAFPFYKCMLNDKLAPLMGLEVDVHLLDGFGSLQVGMGVAYTLSLIHISEPTRPY